MSKSSVVEKQMATGKKDHSPRAAILSFVHIPPAKGISFFTFGALLFTFLLVFLLPLVQHRRRLSRLLQLGHEVLNVVETVIEDPLREGEPHLVELF